MAKSSKSEWGKFAAIEEYIPRRLIFRSWGLDKTGKNHFGYTAPGPILGQYFDPGGAEGVAQKFLKAPLGPKEIRAIQYRFNKKTNDQEYAIALRDEFVDDYHFGLEKAKTIQWDETEIWELFRWAEFGGESDVPREYGPLNGMYRGLLQDAYDAGVNLQLVQKVKERWRGNQPTGEMEPIGFKQANYIVQVNLEHSWNEDDGFVVKIVNCRQNTEMWGQEFPGLTFPELGIMVFPDSELEEWS